MSKVFVSIIAAVSENGVIGNKGRLPWHLPDDMKHFRILTEGHPVIMGRKTYASIPEHHRPLPGRQNIVITRQKGLQIPGCEVVHSLEEALDSCLKSNVSSPTKEVFVIGGGEIYREALPFAQRIYLTRVHATVDGDAFFPEIPLQEWERIREERHKKDQKNPNAFTFQEYRRKM